MTYKDHAFMYLDTETTGLENDDQVTEIGVVTSYHGRTHEYQTFVEHTKTPSLWVLGNTDYLTRIAPAPNKLPMDRVAHYLQAISEDLTARGAEVVFMMGAVPNFDDRMLRPYFPSDRLPWNFHVIDIETLLMGYFHLPYPPHLKEVRALLGLAGENPAAHTALSDAREVQLLHETWLARKPKTYPIGEIWETGMHPYGKHPYDPYSCAECRALFPRETK